MARYDSIGHGYSRTRKEDPRIRARILDALGDARTVVNVGAGSGSYEPTDRHVLAIEPSDVMAAQRPRSLAPALRCSADTLPLRDNAVDAAMSILSVHHWDDSQERGIREMRRVASGPVVVLTCDTDVSEAMWLLNEYLPEVAALDRRTFPRIERLCHWLGGNTRVEIVPIARDCSDWMLMSFWAHPERVFDPNARAGTSGFSRLHETVIDRVLTSLKQDLLDGVWDSRYGHLRSLDEYDAGLRLVVSLPES